MTKMSPRRERERALFLYRNALERGDFDIVIAVLKQAERDAVLAEMIEETAALDEDTSAVPEQRATSLFRKSRGITELVFRRDPSPDSWTRNSDQSEEGTDMLTTFTPARPYPEARKLKWDPITLVAAIVAILVIGALLLYMRSLASPVGGSESIQPEYAAQPTQEKCPASVDHLQLGQAALDGGDYETAIVELTCAIEANPRNYEAYLGRAEASMLSGDLMQADYDYVLLGVVNSAFLNEVVNRYTRAIEANPDDVKAYILRIWPGELAGNEGQTISDIQRVVELDPEWAPGYVFRGWARGGRSKQAWDDFARAVELEPDVPGLYWWIVQVIIWAGGPADSALEYINRAIELASEEGKYYLQRANAYVLAGEDRLAAADYARGIELLQTERVVQNVEPGAPMKLPMAEGRVYSIPFQAKAGQRVTVGAASTGSVWIGSSISAVSVLLDADGTPLVGAFDYHASPRANIANYTISADGTYTVLVTSANPYPDNEISVKVTLTERCASNFNWQRIGQTSLDAGEYQQAIVEFTCAIENDPANYEAYLGRGSAALLAGDLIHGEYDYYMVAVDNPGLLQEAITGYGSAIEANPDDVTAYILRSFAALWRHGVNGNQIREDTKRIVELKPEWGPGYALRGWAQQDYWGGRRLVNQEMSDDFARAVELDPHNPTLYRWFAEAYLLIQKPDLALESINQAIELAPEQGDYYLRRADAYSLAGETALATADYARYFELTPSERTVQKVELGEPTPLRMPHGRVYSIPFEATAGQSVVILPVRTRVTSWWSSLVVVVLAEDGTPLDGAHDYYGSPRISIANYNIPADGTYTVLVASVIPFPDNEISVKVTLRD